MSRNIFYASNIQSDLFPNNSRTKFDQYIDINDLNYIKQNDEIEVAVTRYKQTTFYVGAAYNTTTNC